MTRSGRSGREILHRVAARLLTEVRTRFYRIRYRKVAVWGAGVRVRGRLRLRGPGHIVIGDGCLFDRESSRNAIHATAPTVTVRIGKECYVNGVDIFATEDVTIGDRCIVGECSMVTTDFHSTHLDRRSPDARVNAGPITIGSNVWIAARTVVTKNVSIGDNSVVSIGTIVREDVPPNVIVSSHEQRVVKELRSYQPGPG